MTCSIDGEPTCIELLMQANLQYVSGYHFGLWHFAVARRCFVYDATLRTLGCLKPKAIRDRFAVALSAFTDAQPPVPEHCLYMEVTAMFSSPMLLASPRSGAISAST